MDEDCDWVQVTSERWQAKPQRLEGDGTTATEGVQDLGKITIARLLDLGSGLGQDLLVVARFPWHEPLQDVEQPLALKDLVLFGRKLIRVSRRVIDNRSPQHCSSGR